MDTRRIGVRYPSRAYRQTNTVQSADLYEFRISTTIPPSTTIHMRGGWIWSLPVNWGYGAWCDPLDFDLSDPNIMGWPIQFTNPYWYKDIIIALNPYWGAGDTTQVEHIITRGSGGYGRIQDYETAIEAEQASILWLADTMNSAAADGPQLGILILRNNGIVTIPNSIMPIDEVNRGKSYIFKKDLKFFYQI